MDVNMPKMDGLEATKNIKQMIQNGKIFWDLKIIIASAYTDIKDKNEAI